MLHGLIALLLPLFFALPQPQGGGCVHDFAGILQPYTKNQIEQTCALVEGETSAEIAVVTVSSLNGLTVEDYANQIFNTWGVGQSETNNGVLFLIAPNERRTRIEVGYGLEALLSDARAGDIINQDIIPQFKRGDFPSGIINGVEEIKRVLLSDKAAAHGQTGAAPKYLRALKQQRSLLGWASLAVAFMFFIFTWYIRSTRQYGYVLFLVVIGSLAAVFGPALYANFTSSNFAPSMYFGSGATLLSLISNVRSFLRFRPRTCKKCGSPMILLDESQDDTKLDAGQKMEEKLKVVDYDVWLCPGCSQKEETKNVSFLTDYKECEQCHYVLFKITSKEVVSSATTYSTGLRKLRGRCTYCKHEKEWTEVIPRVSTSSSSSGGGSSSSGGGGGFSGGSSGGGGASGGW